MGWWIWVLLGIGLVAVEFFVPAKRNVLLIGIALIGTGMLTCLGLLVALWVQWLVAGLLSTVLLVRVKPLL